MDKTLYLVDGSGYIFRAFYAIQPLSNSKGLPTNALLGFTRMFGKLLREVSARHIAVAFDTDRPTFRHEMYEEYKANRAECPAELVPQFPYFRKIVQALNIVCLEQAGVEADDLIAAATHHCTDVERVVIVSGDKDLCQLVTDRVEVWDAMRDIHFTPAAVKEKFGVSPGQMIDYLSLVGDSSDNVPGIKGIGPKTAVSLLAYFGSVEAMFKRLGEVTSISGLRGAAGIRSKLESGREMLRLSRELVTLHADVESLNTPHAIDRYSWGAPDWGLLGPLFDELEFSSSLRAVFGGVGGDGAAPVRKAPERKFFAVTPETFSEFRDALIAQREFAFDTETTALDPFSAELVGMSFSWEDGVAYYLPFIAPAASLVLDRGATLTALAPIFSDPNVAKYGANLKFDVGILEAKGVPIRGIRFDVMLASYVLTPDIRQHALDKLAERYLDDRMVSYTDLTRGFTHIGEVPLERVTQYACHDADVAWRVKAKLEEKLHAEPPLRRVFDEIEVPLVPVLSQMERDGIRVDLLLLEQLREEFARDLEGLEREICELVGVTFNLNSPKQMSAILFERLGLPSAGVKKTQSGYSTDAVVLEKLVSRHPVITKILEYRETFKLKTTYVDALTALVHPKTGRIHTSFNQAVAATGRLSSSDPNLQNIPIKNPRGRRIREAFVAERGWLLLAADYSQIELRVLAHLSGDDNLREAFSRGEDIHTATARDLLGGENLSAGELKDLRRIAKTINFGVVYGMGAFRLSQELGISRAEAQRFIDSYFARYPKVRRYFDALSEKSEKLGYVETLFGRRRYLRDLDTSGRDSGYATRSLMNAPIQGTAAEIIKIAMLRLHEKLPREKARMVLQVHDELVVECRADAAELVKSLVVREMENAVRLSVPVQVDVRLAEHWG